MCIRRNQFNVVNVGLFLISGFTSHGALRLLFLGTESAHTKLLYFDFSPFIGGIPHCQLRIPKCSRQRSPIHTDKEISDVWGVVQKKGYNALATRKMEVTITYLETWLGKWPQDSLKAQEPTKAEFQKGDFSVINVGAAGGLFGCLKIVYKSHIPTGL